MNLWQKKLLAFLHDPPHKALDIPGHEQARGTYLRQAGFTDPDAVHGFDKLCDAAAATADRFPFPDPGHLKSGFHGVVRHAIGGSSYDAGEYPSAALAEGHYQTVQKGWHLDDIAADKRDWANFFLHWRRWPVETAKLEPRSYYLPADTRIPDHNIWIHNNIVSALQACVGDNGKFAPAFLIFQTGPVQDFIGQARSTRDLWSGSYLLSWLMAVALKAITDEIGPDAVIFPFLRAQPIFDLLHRDAIYSKVRYGNDTLWERMREHEREMLIPNLPNRFFAVAPSGRAVELARKAELALRDEMKLIANACWDWFAQREHALKEPWRGRYDAQVARFAQVTWQILPWTASVEQGIADFMHFGGEPARNLDRLRMLAAERIPESHRDERYFSNNAKTYLRNSAFLWPYFYALADRLLAARRNTRDFPQWNTDERQTGAVKDSLSGKEEIIGDEKWWKAVHHHPELRFIFRSNDKLGAMNLIKRVWHEAYLGADEWKLDVKKAIAFDSAPAVAAGMWKKDFREKLKEGMTTRGKTYERAVKACEEIQRHAVDWGIRVPEEFKETRIDQWIERIDVEAFEPSTWNEADRKESNVLRALNSLYETKGTGIKPPPKYYAVIAFDGDKMGEWVSGEHENMPAFLDQLASEAGKYFETNVKAVYIEGLKRPISPSYHLQFSEALANFAIYLARPVVDSFGGQLIYAGGDDVLAMVPATEAIRCARALRAAFRGEKAVEQMVPERFAIKGDCGGFVQLQHPKAEQPFLEDFPMLFHTANFVHRGERE